MSENKYNLIIIGAGPAGLSAALYASRGSLSTLVLEKGLCGGELNNTEEIENYPGIDAKKGSELAEMMTNHAKKFGAEIKELITIHSIDLKSKIKTVKTDIGDFYSDAIIIATGSEHRKLGVKGEKEFAGKGVSYCATCDGAFFKNKHVVVIGGGNSAIEEAIFLTRYVEKITIVHRRDSLRAEKILQKRAFSNSKISFIWDTTIEEIKGEKTVNQVILKNLKTGEVSNLSCDGVFIYVGLEPNVSLFKEQIEIDPENKVLSDKFLHTNINGVFVAGDVRNTPLRQAVNAASDGALAAVSAINYIESLED